MDLEDKWKGKTQEDSAEGFKALSQHLLEGLVATIKVSTTADIWHRFTFTFSRISFNLKTMIFSNTLLLF